MLKIAPHLSLPIEAVTQTFALLARRGAGKTHTASVIAEEMLDAGFPIVVLDPVGVWFGLRSLYPVAIFGGERGDMPLQATGGRLVAEFLVEKRLPVILDLSAFGENEMRRFVGEFCQRFYEKNRQPVHVFIDEADEFAPQSGSGGEIAKCLGAMQNIVRRGRARGIGVTLITQRSAVLNKSVLTQTECLIAMQTTAPHDLKAIEEWVKFHGTAEECRGLISSLPKLQQGEAWVYSPGWLKILKQVKFRARKSFDSSRTPQPGEKRQAPANLAEVDLSKLTKEMQETIDRAKADDPKELRKKIAELEKQLKAKPVAEADPKAIERACQNAVTDASRGWVDEKRALQMKLVRAGKTVREIAALAGGLDCEVGFPPAPSIDPAAVRLSRREHSGQTGTLVASGATGALQGNRALPSQERQALRPRKPEESSALTDLQLTKTQQRIIDAIAWYESLGTNSPTLTQIGAVALIDPTGGHFSNTVGPLSTSGLVERGDGRMSLTDSGRSLTRPIEAAESLDGYHDVLRQRIRKMKSAGGKTIEMLNVIIAAGGADLSVEEIGTAVGIDHTGGHFSNMIGPLGTAGLIKRSSGKVTPTEVLFPEGLS